MWKVKELEKICKQCGKKFTLTDEDIKFYSAQGWQLPERCKHCRWKNRENRGENDFSDRGRRSRKSNKGKTSSSGIVLLLLLLLGGTVFAWKSGKIESPLLDKFGSMIEEVTGGSASAESPEIEKVVEAPPEPQEITYYLNTYRKKFHKPNCSSVYEMNPENRQAFYGTRDEVIAMGYSPCANCCP